MYTFYSILIQPRFQEAKLKSPSGDDLRNSRGLSLFARNLLGPSVSSGTSNHGFNHGDCLEIASRSLVGVLVLGASAPPQEISFPLSKLDRNLTIK
jgi:hypothetical protein